MGEAGLADYTLAGITYWADEDLQEAVDEHRSRQVDVALIARPEPVLNDQVYTRYELPWGVKAVEGTAGGTDTFRVYDSTGATIAFSGFSFNERDLAVTFTADTEGSARYWSGYAYDLRAAAREIWLAKAGHVWSAINFSADGHKFEREALHAHCLQMAEVFGYRRGLQTTRLVRTDLGARSPDADRL